MILWSMFIAAFLAATLLPGGSEVLLTLLLTEHPQAWFGLWIAASAGNTLGALTSFYLGYIGRYAYTPEQLAAKKYQRPLHWLQRYGVWSLLLSWLPLVGDLLCLLAGWLHLPIWASIGLIALGKTLRYLILILLFQAATA